MGVNGTPHWNLNWNNRKNLFNYKWIKNKGNALVEIIVFPAWNTKINSLNQMKYTSKYTIQNVGFGKIFKF